AVLREQFLHEFAVALRNGGAQLLFELGRIDLAHALVLAGNDDVDAVRLVADVLVDPLELDFELSRRKPDGAEDAEPARLADCRDDVAAVAEGEDGELDAEPVTDRSVHASWIDQRRRRRQDSQMS